MARPGSLAHFVRLGERPDPLPLMALLLGAMLISNEGRRVDMLESSPGPAVLACLIPVPLFLA